MITPKYILTMAVYNRWQNQSIYSAAASLSDAARREDRGAFFGSIHETLCHILWGDKGWMVRFAETPPPNTKSMADSRTEIADWETLVTERIAFDAVMVDWAKSVTEEWLASRLSFYSNAKGGQTEEEAGRCVTHLFNHQTHHRGQVHAMLTAAGAKTEDTDLFLMPDSSWDNA